LRTSSFNVKGQIIERDPNCDFSGLVAGTEGYVKAKFTFSEDWNGCVKVVGFSSKGVEFEPCKLSGDNICEIPEKALQYHEFSIKVYGKRNGVRITTREANIKQYGGKL
jgi:hypothetical protein